jgi:hypothetical protein
MYRKIKRKLSEFTLRCDESEALDSCWLVTYARDNELRHSKRIGENPACKPSP